MSPGLTTDQSGRLWAAMCRLGEFTPRDLMLETGLPESTVHHIKGRWVRDGWVEEVRRKGSLALYRVAPDARPAEVPSARQSPEANMWRALRILRDASPRDLAAHATTETVQVDEAAAVRFCRMLCDAGYLRVMQKARPGIRPARYRLVRDTGPLPPERRRITVVVDMNLHQYARLPEVPR